MGSGVTMGTVLLIMGTTRFTIGIISGVIVDQIGPKKIMIYSDLLRAVMMVIFYLALFFGNIPIFLLYTLAFIFGFIDSFYWPASQAIRPRVIGDKDKLSKANSIIFTSIRTINLVGPVIASFSIFYINYPYTFLMVSLTFILSALLILFMNINDNHRAIDLSKHKSHWVAYVDGFKTGWEYILKQKIIFKLILIMFFANIGANGIMAVMSFLVNELHLGIKSLGIFDMAMALGSIVCGFFLSFMTLKKSSLHGVTIGFFFQGLCCGLVYYMSQTFQIAVVLFFEGVFTAIVGVLIPTLIQTVVPDKLMGRVGSVLMTVTMASNPFAHFAFGVLVEVFRAQTLFLLAGAIEIFVSAIAFLYLIASRTPFYVVNPSSETAVKEHV